MVLLAPVLVLLAAWVLLEVEVVRGGRALGAVMWSPSATVEDLQVFLVGAAVVVLLVGGIRLLIGHRSAPGKRELAGAITWTWALGCTAYVLTLVVVGAGGWLAAVVAGCVGSAAGGLVGAVLAGPPPTTSLVARAPVPDTAPRAHLAAGEVAVWTGWTRTPWWVYGAELLVVVTNAVNVVVLGPGFGVLVVLLVPTIGLFVVTTTFRVSVGEAGLVVRSLPLGVPRVVVPLEHVVRADVVHLSPFADFGTWGYVATRIGAVVVTREGPALQVRRGDGSFLALTVDDAEEAAALLNTLADRRRAREPVAT